MPTTPPDILLIILDTQRRDRLSVYGGIPHETSPHFDAFAAQAALFERAISPAQWTIPAHASIFTGVYPTTHQLTQSYHALSGSYPTLAEILQAGGYQTVGFCNNPLVGLLNNELQRGFGEFYNYAGTAPNRPQDVTRGRIRRALDRRWRRFSRRVGNRFAHSDRLFQVSMNPFLVPLWTRGINYKGHTAHSINDTIDYLRQQRAGGRRAPLFAFLNLMGTHLPYRPPQDALRRAAPHISRDRAAHRFMRRFNADAARWASPAIPPLKADERAIIEAFYDAEIIDQDAHLGRLLDSLRTSGALDDTLVIIAADHGEGHGDHGFFGHSFVVYQELVHVPLAIHDPRQPGARRVTTPVSTRRIFHTILHAAGLTPPLDADDPNADVNRLTLALPHTEQDIAFAEAVPPSTFVNLIERRSPALIDTLQLKQTRRAIYQDRYKLALVGESIEGLFDVARDPHEAHDIAAAHASLVGDLHDKARAFVSAAEQYRAGSAAFASASPEMDDHLRALGYIE